MNREYNGVIPSPDDPRDWHISRCMDMPTGSVAEILPKEYHVEYLPEIEDQGQVNSCTAFAMSGIFECIHYKLYGETKKYSVGYLYGNRRETTYKDEGCIMRDVTKTVQKYGDVYSNVYEDLTEVSEVIDNFERVYEYIQDHAKKLVAGYVRIRDEDEAKAFLFKYKVPLFASAKMKYIHPLAKSGGYHAIMITGYTKNYFKCQNSWGRYDCPRPEIKFDNFAEVWGVIPMEDIKFTDVTKDDWAYDDIMLCAKTGVVKGYEDNTIRPDNNITRREMMVMLARTIRYMEENFEKKL